jgi:hypothetical protein
VTNACNCVRTRLTKQPRSDKPWRKESRALALVRPSFEQSQTLIQISSASAAAARVWNMLDCAIIMLYPASAADPTQARSWFFPHPSAQPQLAIGLPQNLEQMSQLEAPYMNVANVPAHPPTHNCSGRFLESSLKVALRRRPEVPEIELASCLAVSPRRSCSPPADGLCLWCPPANSSRQPAQRKRPV